MTYYDTDLGVSEMSRQELNEIALRGGKVGGIAYGYACTGYLPRERHGYGFRWVGTQGMGNCGELVLTARSAEAAEYLRQGRIAVIMADHGIGYTEAAGLEKAARRIRYGREHAVLAYVVETCASPAWAFFPGVGRGVWKWFREFKMPETDLTAPRLGAVAQIVAGL